VLIDLAADSDLFIAECYYWDKAVPYHLRHTDLVAHRDQLDSRHIVMNRCPRTCSAMQMTRLSIWRMTVTS
jgi:hypothetical protein